MPSKGDYGVYEDEEIFTYVGVKELISTRLRIINYSERCFIISVLLGEHNGIV
jgi:hypothetical protein